MLGRHHGAVLVPLQVAMRVVLCEVMRVVILLLCSCQCRGALLGLGLLLSSIVHGDSEQVVTKEIGAHLFLTGLRFLGFDGTFGHLTWVTTAAPIRQRSPFVSYITREEIDERSGTRGTAQTRLAARIGRRQHLILDLFLQTPASFTLHQCIRHRIDSFILRRILAHASAHNVGTAKHGLVPVAGVQPLVLLLFDPGHFLKLGAYLLRRLFPHSRSDDRDVLVLDLDGRGDELGVGDVFAEEDKGIAGALDVADGLLFVSITSQLALRLR